VSTSLSAIDETAWNHLFPSNPEGYRFFQTIEETLAPQFKPYYIMITEATRLVCLAPCYATDYSLETTTGGVLKAVASWIKRGLPRAFTIRTLFCGSPTGEGRLGIDDQIDPAALMNSLVNAMRSIAQQERARLIAFKDFPDCHTPLLDRLLSAGFHKIPSYPGAVLELRFPSFNAYLASLSRATRKDLKRKFRKLDESGVRIEMAVSNALGEALDDAYRLYLSTFERSDAKFELLSREFFRRIAINMPKETRYFLWRIDGRLVAFDLCLVSKAILVDEYIGMDYEVAHQHHLYYLTLRDILRWCIEHGIQTYSSGALNYDPKKRLDFRLIPQRVYLRHLNGAMNVLFGPLSRLLKPENYDPLLQASKTTGPDDPS